MLAEPRPSSQFSELDHLEAVSACSKSLAASAWTRLLVGKTLLLSHKFQCAEHLFSTRKPKEIQIVGNNSGFTVVKFPKRERSVLEFVRDAVQMRNKAFFSKSDKCGRISEFPEQAKW